MGSMAEMNFMQRSRQNGYGSLLRTNRYSLIEDARTAHLEQQRSRRHSATVHRARLLSDRTNESTIPGGDDLLQALDDNGVEAFWALFHADWAETDDGTGSGGGAAQPFALLLRCHSDPGKLAVATVLHVFETHKVEVRHIETRHEKPAAGSLNECGVGDRYTVLLRCTSTKNSLLHAAKPILGLRTVGHVQLVKDSAVPGGSPAPWCGIAPGHIDKHIEEETETEVIEELWIPGSAYDLDKCGHVVTKYEPTDDPRHPGYGDAEYIARRAAINKVAMSYKYGQTLPEVEYTAKEQETWRAVYLKLKELYPTAACHQFQNWTPQLSSDSQANLARLEEIGLYTPERIPQLNEVNKFLQTCTGFTLRPCGGLLSARDFLASLSLRTFQATQYVRHEGKPHHSPEPDAIHELLGHVPMLADCQFAQFSQEIGLLSLGASDEDIEKLATVYWFMIEFGLCREANGSLRACGAGLLSAYGELQHALSDVPRHQQFDAQVVAKQTYSDDDYQPVYFVAESINSAMHQLRAYATAIRRPFRCIYEPHTRTVRKVYRGAAGAVGGANEVCDMLDGVVHAVNGIKMAIV